MYLYFANWLWLPHPAHFVGAENCAFRLSTVVGNGRFIVSTIGEYRRTELDLTYSEIGLGRLYETMVFKAKPSTNKCCPFEVEDYSELEMIPANDPDDARKNHMAACEKWHSKGAVTFGLG